MPKTVSLGFASTPRGSKPRQVDDRSTPQGYKYEYDVSFSVLRIAGEQSCSTVGYSLLHLGRSFPVCKDTLADCNFRGRVGLLLCHNRCWFTTWRAAGAVSIMRRFSPSPAGGVGYAPCIQASHARPGLPVGELTSGKFNHLHAVKEPRNGA